MAPTSELDLLEGILPAFLNVAAHLIGDSVSAKKAQAAVNQDSQLNRPFHATVYAQLRIIEPFLWEWSDWTYLQSQTAQKAVRELLVILDDIAHDAFPGYERSPSQPFPRLHIIKNIETLDKDPLELDDRLLAIQACLSCPCGDIRERFEDGLIACATALDPDSLPFSVHAIAQGEKLLPPVKAICESAERLGDLLKSQLICEPCGYQHDAVFSFATPCSGRDAFRGCLMCFRRGPLSQEWHTARIEFARSSSGLGAEAGVIFCQEVSASTTEIHLRPNNSSFFKVPIKDAHRRTGSVKLTSLSAWIADTEGGAFGEVDEKDRLVLCLLLSYGYLYLSGSFLWPDHRIGSGIWLADHLRNKIIRPFLQFSASVEHKGYAVERCINGARPSLPAFGRLILEIWLGRPIELGNNDMKTAGDDCKKSAIGPHIWKIAHSCIEAEDILKKEGRLRDDTLMYEKFTSDVVKTLQYITKIAGVTPTHIIKLLEAQMPANTGAVHATAASTTLHHSGSQAMELDSLPADSSNVNTIPSTRWFERLQTDVHSALDLNKGDSSRIKVAILDTGASFDISQYKTLHRGRISDCRTWCDADCSVNGRSIMKRDGRIETTNLATDDHGTHSLSVLRKVAPNCEVFVAQVFKDRGEVKERYPTAAQAQRIAFAIEYAAHQEQADIITMSFGFSDEVEVICKALNGAAMRTSKPCLLFAAASNFGANEDVQWPASHDQVICIHATDYLGNKYAENVTSERPQKEFATLGVGVEAIVGPYAKQSVKSGTSVASPIAAGVAALILDDVQKNRNTYLASLTSLTKFNSTQQAEIYDKKVKKLRTWEGMSRVLMSMSVYRDGYNYLRPWNVLRKSYEHDYMRARDILAEASGRKVVRANPS